MSYKNEAAGGPIGPDDIMRVLFFVMIVGGVSFALYSGYQNGLVREAAWAEQEAFEAAHYKTKYICANCDGVITVNIPNGVVVADHEVDCAQCEVPMSADDQGGLIKRAGKNLGEGVTEGALDALDSNAEKKAEAARAKAAAAKAAAKEKSEDIRNRVRGFLNRDEGK